MNLLTEIRLSGYAAPDPPPEGPPSYELQLSCGDPVWNSSPAWGMWIQSVEQNGVARGVMRWQQGGAASADSAMTPPQVWYPCSDRIFRLFSDGGEPGLPSLATLSFDGVEVLTANVTDAALLFAGLIHVRWRLGGSFPDKLEHFDIAYRGLVTRFHPSYYPDTGFLGSLDGRFEWGDNVARDEAGVEYVVRGPKTGELDRFTASTGWYYPHVFAYHRLAPGADWAEPTDTNLLVNHFYPPLGWAGNGRHIIRQTSGLYAIGSTNAGQTYDNDTGALTEPAVKGLWGETDLRAVATNPATGQCMGAKFDHDKLVAVAHDGTETDVCDQPDAAEVLAFAAPDGTWRLLLVDGATVTWYTAAVGDEGNWTAGTPQTLDADLRVVTGARGADGTLAIIGHQQAAGEVRLVYSVGFDATFGATVTVAAGIAAPYYLTQLPDGSWEAGWLVDAAWVRYTADYPAGPWTEVTP